MKYKISRTSLILTISVFIVIVLILLLLGVDKGFTIIGGLVGLISVFISLKAIEIATFNHRIEHSKEMRRFFEYQLSNIKPFKTHKFRSDLYDYNTETSSQMLISVVGIISILEARLSMNFIDTNGHFVRLSVDWECIARYMDVDIFDKIEQAEMLAIDKLIVIENYMQHYSIHKLDIAKLRGTYLSNFDYDSSEIKQIKIENSNFFKIVERIHAEYKKCSSTYWI